MEVVINKCFGGFGLSILAEIRICEKKGIEPVFVNFNTGAEYTKEEALKADSSCLFCKSLDVERDDIDLITVVKELGDLANTPYSRLKIVDIPEDICFEIEDYDGIETIHEAHRSWV